MIQLRDYKNSDIEPLAKNANDPLVAAYMRLIFPSPYTIADAKWWIEEGHCQEGMITQAIEYDDQCIGNINVFSLHKEPKNTGELGYWIGSQYWGKGIASKAISLFTELVFEKNHVNKITAMVASPNIASIRVLEKCGYQFKTVNKNALEVRKGIFDEHVYMKIHNK